MSSNTETARKIVEIEAAASTEENLRQDDRISVPWTSSITEIGESVLRTHGVDQREMIREFSYEEMLFFVIQGHRPSPGQLKVLRGLLVSFVSHGITSQSTLAVMLAADTRAEFVNALISGFSAGFGPYHLGALRPAMVDLQRLSGLTPDAIRQEIEERCAKGERVKGFGHRYHRQDPRADEVIKLAQDQGVAGPHIKAALCAQEVVYERKGILLNLDGAGGAVMLDLGFAPEIGPLFTIVGRSPMLAAVYLERMAERPDRSSESRLQTCTTTSVPCPAVMRRSIGNEVGWPTALGHRQIEQSRIHGTRVHRWKIDHHRRDAGPDTPACQG